MAISRELLNSSYSYCRGVARRRATNFYYAFTVLPRAKRDAMCAVYAFMRYCDDIADDIDIKLDKKLMLERWRQSLDKALSGDYEDSPILPAFHDTLVKFNIPAEYFHQLIDGAAMDLSLSRYRTFDQLYDYCYRVASVVGLVCICILGYDNPDANIYAEYCGIAFQLTNILRDIREDAAMGRIYLPEEDLWAFHCPVEDLINGTRSEEFSRLMRFEVWRARDYYHAARPLLQFISSSGRSGLVAMISIYSRILDKIEERDYDVFSERVSLSKSEKLVIAARTLVRPSLDGGERYLVELQS